MQMSVSSQIGKLSTNDNDDDDNENFYLYTFIL